MAMACNPSARQAGFVLATTLWLLAGITVVVGLMVIWAREQVQQAQQLREQVQDRIAMQETRDTLLYIAATRDITLAGLATELLPDDMRAIRRLDEFGGLVRDPVGSELRLDDTHYRGVRDTLFSLQDEAGLFSVMLPSPSGLDAFLRQQGIENERVAPLRDAFLDYVDEDDLTRLNGAEADDYRRAHRPPPANRRLLAPAEIERVFGWDKLPPATLARMRESITPYQVGGINLNTAPKDLLPLWIDGCPQTCDRLLARREQQPLHNSSQAEGVLGVALRGDNLLDYRYLASDTLRLTLWGRTGPAQRFHVRLTAMADKKAPWAILASYTISRPDKDDPAHPTGSPFFADKDTARGR